MRRTKEKAEQTSTDILTAAARLFCEKGVPQTSLQEIAQAANVTRGAIYWHFKNKIDIFDALHESLHTSLTEIILQDAEKDHPEPLIQMQELCIKLLLDLRDNPQKRQALTLFFSQQVYTGDLAPFKSKHLAKKKQSRQLFIRYFEKAKAKGSLPANSDPEVLMLALHCYMKGIIMEYLNDSQGFDITTKAPDLVRLFFRHLTA